MALTNQQNKSINSCRRQGMESRPEKLLSRRTRTLKSGVGLEEVCSFQYDLKKFQDNRHRGLNTLTKRNQAGRQNSTRLGHWLNRLARFAISIQYTARNNLKKYSYLSRHLVEKGINETSHEEEFGIKKFSN